MSVECVSLIRERLQNKFSPSYLDVIDDGYKHHGHEGSKGGAGHYTVVIVAESLKGKSRIMAHREIYQVLNDLIPDKIHALVIKLDPSLS